MKKVVFLVAAILLVPVTFFFLTIGWAQLNSYSPEVVNFSPQEFNIRSDSDFFYSIGGELKYGRKLSSSDQTIINIKERNNYVYIAPNNKLAAVVIDNKLWVVSSDGKVNESAVNTFHSYSAKNMKIGSKFFDSMWMQWGKNSESIYIIQNTVFQRKDSDYIGAKPTSLFEFNLKAGELNKVVSSLHNVRYFFDDGGIYYSVATETGDLILKYSTSVGNSEFVDMTSLTSIKEGKEVFYNFILDRQYEEVLKYENKIDKQYYADGEHTDLFIMDKLAISIKKGQGFKGRTSGLANGLNAFTPDSKYYLLNIYSKQFAGQLLFDVDTLDYKTLPQNTRIYQNLNTQKTDNWRIDGSGIKVKYKKRD